jgi:hypothetical protein
MGFGAVETLGQLALGDVSDEADMSSGGLQVLVHIEGGGMAARSESRLFPPHKCGG